MHCITSSATAAALPVNIIVSSGISSTTFVLHLNNTFKFAALTFTQDSQPSYVQGFRSAFMHLFKTSNEFATLQIL